MRTAINIALAAAVVFGSVSTTLAANHPVRHRHAYAMERVSPPNWSGGRQVAAPPWSFACMTDHGPTRAVNPCGYTGTRIVSAELRVHIADRAIQHADKTPVSSARPVISVSPVAVAGFARGRSTPRDRPPSSGERVRGIAALARRRVWNKARAVPVFSPKTVLHMEDNPMSAKIKGALIGAMIFGSSSVALAREAATNHVPHKACSGIQTACLPWQAPIGHRQPGAAEVPDNLTLPPSDLELEALEKALDRKLMICRGC